jgi:hypothetical protein
MKTSKKSILCTVFAVTAMAGHTPTWSRAALPSATPAEGAQVSDWVAAALVGMLATAACNAYRVLASPHDLIEADDGHVPVFRIESIALSRVPAAAAMLTNSAPPAGQALTILHPPIPFTLSISRRKSP